MKEKIALIFGGGGVRGYAHIGAIKRFEEKNIIPSEIIGTSFGALVGVCLASGKNYEDIKEIFTPKNIFKLIDPAEKLKFGFIKGEKLVKHILDSINCKKFSDLKIKFLVNAIDINTGNEKVFSEGKLYDALCSTIAVPGAVTPKKIGKNYFIDGGIFNPLGIHLVSKNINKIIAIDVSDAIIKIDDDTDKMKVLQQIIAFSQKREIKQSLKVNKKKIILLEPLNKPFNLFDFRKKNRDEIIKMGYKEAKNKLK